MEKSCEICQGNVFQHRFYHRSHHSFCNACIYMKMVSEQIFENICKYCSRTFKDRYKLKNHLGVHIETFMCEICDKQFARKETLKKHTEDFHVEKEVIDFSCTVCDVKLSNKRYLIAHGKKTSPLRALTSAFCVPKERLSGKQGI